MAVHPNLLSKKVNLKFLFDQFKSLDSLLAK